MFIVINCKVTADFWLEHKDAFRKIAAEVLVRKRNYEGYLRVCENTQHPQSQ